MPFWLTWFFVGIFTAASAAAVVQNNPNQTSAYTGASPTQTQQILDNKGQ